MDVAELMGAIIIVGMMWAIFMGTGWYMSRAMGRPPWEGLVLTFLFGPLGLLLAAAVGFVVALKAPGPPPGEARVTLSKPPSTGVQRR